MTTHTNEATHEWPAIDYGLLGKYPIQFRQYLLEQNYARNTIKGYLYGIATNLAELMKARGIGIRDLDEAQAVALVAKTGWLSSPW
jgi:hypothetical protein